MRSLLGLAAALFTLFALPTLANAATTPCGFLNGQFDIAGRTYAGEATYAGVTYQIAVSFNRECGVVLSQTGKNPRGGTWLQKNDRMAIKIGDADFLGTVAADGSITGQMATHDDKVGTFTLKAPKGGAAPAATGGGSSGACGRGDAEHPYVVGRVYHGGIVWKGSEAEELSIAFNADCSTRYVYDDGSVGTARWSQNGESLNLDVNDGYASYTGYATGNLWSGALKNREGKTGSFAFERKQ